MRKLTQFCLGLMLLPITAIAQNQPTMKDVLGKYFLVGTALNSHQIWTHDPKIVHAITDNFNSVVAENCMKGEIIHPEEDYYDWHDASCNLCAPYQSSSHFQPGIRAVRQRDERRFRKFT